MVIISFIQIMLVARNGVSIFCYMLSLVVIYNKIYLILLNNLELLTTNLENYELHHTFNISPNYAIGMEYLHMVRMYSLTEP